MADVDMQDAAVGPTASQQLDSFIIPTQLINADLSALDKVRRVDTVQKMLDQLLERVRNTASFDAEFNDGDGLAPCDQVLRRVIDAKKDTDALAMAVERTAAMAAGAPISLADTIRERLEVAKTTYRDQDDKTKYMRSQPYVAFKELIWTIQSPDDAFPGMASFFKAPGDADDDDEIEMTSRGPRDLRCPLTLTRFVDPVRSQKCVHTFSKQAIMSMLRGQRIPCPVAGCPQTIGPNDLERDRVMERLLAKEAEREAEEEDEEEEDTGAAGNGDDDDDVLVL